MWYLGNWELGVFEFRIDCAFDSGAVVHCSAVSAICHLFGVLGYVGRASVLSILKNIFLLLWWMGEAANALSIVKHD